MNSKTHFFIALLLLIVTELSAQNPSKYNGSLVSYLTEVNLNLETKMISEYCACTNKSELINLYQDVVISYNSYLNSTITEIILLTPKKSIQRFKTINSSVISNNNLISAYSKLKAFIDYNNCKPKNFWPATIAFSEITGVVGSIIGVLGEATKRREGQKTKILEILESLKIPSIKTYECKALE